VPLEHEAEVPPLDPPHGVTPVITTRRWLAARRFDAHAVAVAGLGAALTAGPEACIGRQHAVVAVALDAGRAGW
jgi:hypothetical protein